MFLIALDYTEYPHPERGLIFVGVFIGVQLLIAAAIAWRTFGPGHAVEK